MESAHAHPLGPRDAAFGWRRFPWLTTAVCVPAAALFWAVRLGWAPTGLADTGPVDLADALHVVELGARSTALVGDASERWRLLSSHFVHTSTTHLVFNLAFAFPVGGALEQVVRRSDYAALLAVAMVGSSLGSLVFTPQVSAGASGIVFGLLAAAVILGLRHGARLGPRVRHHFGLWVLPFLLVTLAITVGNPSVDNASHIGGLVAGVAFAPWMRLRLPEPVERSSPAIALALGACAIAMLAAPAIARRGAPVRVALGHGWSADVPSQWAPRYGQLGESEWVTAGGMVVLTAGDAPVADPDALRRWYVEHRIAPLAGVGRSRALREIPVAVPLPLPERAVHLRFALQREQTPVIRDVVFLPDPATARMAVLSLEVPRAWAQRYDETRHAVVGSLRAGRPGGTGVTRISVAAIE